MCIFHFSHTRRQLKIWRNVDSATSVMSPSMVDAKAVRAKLSKQLGIDLIDNENEHVHLRAEPIGQKATEQDVYSMLAEFEDVDKPCDVQIRQLGEYLARISLRGGYSIPLRVQVLPR